MSKVFFDEGKTSLLGLFKKPLNTNKPPKQKGEPKAEENSFLEIYNDNGTKAIILAQALVPNGTGQAKSPLPTKKPDKVAENIKKLKDPDPRKRIAAIKILGRLIKKRRPSVLFAEKFFYTRDPNIMKKKAFGFLLFARRLMLKERSISPLIDTLKDSHNQVRITAIKTLTNLGCINITPYAILKSLSTQLTQEPNKKIKQKIETSIKKMKEATFWQDINDLKKGYAPFIIWGAARSLRSKKDKRALPHLIAALKDKNTRVRKMVVLSLSNLGDKRAIIPLKRQLKTESDKEVKEEIKEALRRLLPRPTISSITTSFDSARIRWKPYRGAKKYIIKLIRKGKIIKTKTESGTSVTFKRLEAGKKHKVTIQAVLPHGKSGIARKTFVTKKADL